MLFKKIPVIFLNCFPMITYTTPILKFDKQGEKTGWTYIEVPQKIASQIKPGYKKSFRVKGRLDEYRIDQVAMIPTGNGDFIIPINAAMRKATGKKKGGVLTVELQEDKKEYRLNTELMECLKDEPAALKFFNTKPASHQRYYSKWIESAKTETTKTKRIAIAVSSLAKKMEFGEMLKSQQRLKEI
jgi:sugar phosphate isomerase/epimerase